MLRPDGERVAGHLGGLDWVGAASARQRAQRAAQVVRRDFAEPGRLRRRLDAPDGDVPLWHRSPQPRHEDEVVVPAAAGALLKLELFDEGPLDGREHRHDAAGVVYVRPDEPTDCRYGRDATCSLVDGASSGLERRLS